MPTSPSVSNVVALPLLREQEPPPYPSDRAWAALCHHQRSLTQQRPNGPDRLVIIDIAPRSTATVARYLARHLHVRSPLGVSAWTLEQLRAHYSPLLLERWQAAKPERCGTSPRDGQDWTLPWVNHPLRSKFQR